MEQSHLERTSYGDWRDQLFADGYVVVKGVIPPGRAQSYVERMMGWLESFPFGFRRDRESTWKATHLPPSLKGGMYQGYAVQHEQFMWDARQEPGIIAAFAKIWGTSDLLVSFDGMNLTLPDKTNKKQTNPWPHVDQSPERPGLHCIQGLVNLAPNGPKDGGLVVLQGSHKLNEAFFTQNPQTWSPADWFSFNNKHITWFEKQGCRRTKVCAEPGDLILWDSRTVHYNVLPGSDALRAAMYICYTPASFATTQALGKKAALFNARMGTTHWPHLSVPIGSSQEQDNQARTPTKQVYARSRPVEEPEETDLVLQLAGALPYY